MAPRAYLSRSLEAVVREVAAQFPVVVVTGPRQAGKTTMLRTLLHESHRYASMDDPQLRRLAERDPPLFLEQFPPPVLVDEVQYVPSLLPYVKMRVDADRRRKGQFVLTGSQHFALMQGVTESLAGRAAVISLLSLSWAERERQPSAVPFFGQGARTSRPRGRAARALAEAWIRGSWPELVSDAAVDHRIWFASYVQTYLERDVRALRQVGDLGEFQSFLQAVAARSAQLLSLSDLSRDLGVAVNTVKAWVRVLEASQQVVLLRPYHRSLGKRLIKSPKLFVTETGLLCHLLGLRDADHAVSGPAAGALFETAVFGEILRAFLHQGETPRVFFWRTAAGDEVDFVVERQGRLVPIEAKLTKTPTPRHARSIERFRSAYGRAAEPGILVCLVDEPAAVTRDCRAVPFEQFALGG